MERIDPQPATDEKTTLLQFLDFQRATLLLKAEGLDERQLRQPLPSSSLTLAGLLKHLALVEDSWIQVKFAGQPEPEPWASAPDEDPDWEFNSAGADDPRALRDLYQAACERSRRSIINADLEDLSAGLSREGHRWNLRWILTHLIEETSRHNGHADLLREAIDGSVGE
ncbi:DinB family protein [Paenarthrobacter sp. Z7-10]|uniref:DinB family protein n=1 Tax=Paenarthrobacter sp. Z7-10 TaxID=2787635 RepID=UPI0022A9BA56|nr:DinB family protein [Paenarthrobacter sp. Z7-10]MCZ2403295.1 DinB family protein [Paenarthrobacter sp. Z7-10]